MAATKAQNPLTRRVGPLPVFGWLIVAVAGWFLWSHFKGSSAAAAPTTTSGTPGMFAAPTDQGGGGGGTGIPQLPIPTSTTILDPAGGSVPAAPAATPASTPAAEAAPVDQGAAPGASAQGAAVAPFNPADHVPAQTYYTIPSSDASQPPTYFQPSGWFQNEQGYQTVTTPPQLATGQTPSPGVAYAA